MRMRTLICLSAIISMSTYAAEVRPVKETRPVCNVDMSAYSVAPPCAPRNGLTLKVSNIGIEFEHGQTADFADVYVGPVGPVQGYVWMKVQGEWVLVPFYK
jgi:hypothetical protein